MAFNSYVSEPMSKKNVREIANAFREFLGIKNSKYVEVVKYLDKLVDYDPLYDYEIVDDNEMEPSKQADTDVINHKITIKQSVYDGACDGDKVDRMTIAHELGHYVMVCMLGIKFARNFNKKGYVETFRDPEWQATVFASEFLAPVDQIKYMSVKDISNEYGITERAARSQLRHI